MTTKPQKIEGGKKLLNKRNMKKKQYSTKEEQLTTWINTIPEITNEPKNWTAFPTLWINESYVCIFDVDGEKRVIKIKK